MIHFVLISLIVAWGRFFNALAWDISAFNADKHTSEACCGKGPVFYFNFYRYLDCETVKGFEMLLLRFSFLISNDTL